MTTRDEFFKHVDRFDFRVVKDRLGAVYYDIKTNNVIGHIRTYSADRYTIKGVTP